MPALTLRAAEAQRVLVAVRLYLLMCHSLWCSMFICAWPIDVIS